MKENKERNKQKSKKKEKRKKKERIKNKRKTIQNIKRIEDGKSRRQKAGKIGCVNGRETTWKYN